MCECSYRLHFGIASSSIAPPSPLTRCSLSLTIGATPSRIDERAWLRGTATGKNMADFLGKPKTIFLIHFFFVSVISRPGNFTTAFATDGALAPNHSERWDRQSGQNISLWLSSVATCSGRSEKLGMTTAIRKHHVASISLSFVCLPHSASTDFLLGLGPNHDNRCCPSTLLSP